MPYIVVFAAAVCLVCSLAISSVAVVLKPQQEKNKLLDRMTKVLEVSGLKGSDEKISDEEVEKRFNDNVVSKIVVLKTGEYDDAIDANTFDQQRAARDPAQSTPAPTNKAKVRRLPENALVYQVNTDEASLIVIPIEGYGLWGTLYGYLALDADTTTIRGIIYYDHKETPGLGGEVENPSWKGLWPGRKAFDENWQPVIAVARGKAGSVTDDPHRVDGLAGATMTSRGVTNMLAFWLGENGFGPYLSNMRQGRGTS